MIVDRQTHTDTHTYTLVAKFGYIESAEQSRTAEQNKIDGYTADNFDRT